MSATTQRRLPISLDSIYVVAILASLPGIVWLVNVGDIGAYFTHHVPRGQLLYLFSKLFGLYAYFLMALQVVVGMQGRASRYFVHHPKIGLLITISVVTHLSLFVIAASLRAGYPALDNFILAFNQGYYKSAVSLGVIAAYGMVPVIIAGVWLRKHIRLFRFLHRLAYLVTGLGWLHSFSIGTETRSPIVLMFYSCLLVWVGYYFMRRLLMRFRRA